MNQSMQRIMLDRPPADTRWFIGRLNAISPGNLRALWLPHTTDVTTNALKPDGRAWTANATLQSRFTRQGNGILVTFNGSSESISTPDTDNLSFGNGTADSPFTVAALVNVTDTAGVRAIITKDTYSAAAEEWGLFIQADDAINFQVIDQSSGGAAQRISDAAVTQGSPVLISGTYTAATGGTTAGDDITLYENGAVKASTPTTSPTYVAMENLTVPVLIGAHRPAAPVNFFAGSIGFVAVYAAAFAAAQHRQINDVKREYYGLAA